MTVLHTHARPGTPEFTANEEAHAELVADLRARQAEAALGGGEKARDAPHVARQAAAARARRPPADPGSPFLELSPLAAHDMYDGAAPGAGVVAGIARVHGREVIVVANDATVKGGTYYPMTVKKHLRAQRAALRTACRASTSSTPAARSCRCRTRSSPTASTSGGSSSTRPTCPRRASRRSPP